MVQIEKRFISLFGGIGGFDLAAVRNGFECVGYYEIDKYCVQTYNKNFKTTYDTRDIRAVESDDIPNHDLLCAGFPCQTFSIAGKRRGFQDTRGTLFFEIARILKAKRPTYFLLENVKGLLNHDEGKTFSVILQTLDELGYDFQWMVFNSKFFGVPQNRERVFIVGNLRGERRPEILPFREDDYKTDEDWASVRTITGGAHSGGLHSQMTGIKYARKDKAQHSRVYDVEGIAPTLARASKLSGDCTPKIIVEGNLYPSGGEAGNIINPNGVFPTLKQGKRGGKAGMPSIVMNTIQEAIGTRAGSSATFKASVNNVYQSIGQIRRLTPIECERLQGFPDNWTKGVSDTQRYKQLGNAVTVNVVESIIRKMLPLAVNKKEDDGLPPTSKEVGIRPTIL